MKVHYSTIDWRKGRIVSIEYLHSMMNIRILLISTTIQHPSFSNYIFSRLVLFCTMFSGKFSAIVRHIFLPLNQLSTFDVIRHSSTKLYAQMKKLIDCKQFRHALDVFDKQSHIADDLALNMALKACSNLQDYQRGLEIVRQLSPKSLNNPFIQTSLLHFYSEYKHTLSLFKHRQCQERWHDSLQRSD